MKKQVPKNVRQIGNVSDSTKIYVEDYVDTFFNQLVEKETKEAMGAFLVGETYKETGEEYIYISGALLMKKTQINDDVWKKACKECKEYFENAEILGWFLIQGDQRIDVNTTIRKMHQKYFSRERTVFVVKDARSKEETFYVHKFHDLMEIPGHYVYYEKNAEMQNYMIAARKKSGATPSEVVEDRVTKNFRDVVKEQMETEKKKKKTNAIYAASIVLILLIFGVGITVANNYEKISALSDKTTELPQITLPFAEEEEEEEKEEEEETIVQPDEKLEEEKEEEEKSEGEGELPPVLEEEQEQETLDTYVVQKGDTLMSICEKIFGVVSYVDEICELNGLEDVNLIYEGQKLLLPKP